MSKLNVSKFALQMQRTGSWEKPTYALLSVHKCLHANLDILRRTESSISGKLLTHWCIAGLSSETTGRNSEGQRSIYSLIQ